MVESVNICHTMVKVVAYMKTFTVIHISLLLRIFFTKDLENAGQKISTGVRQC